MWFLSPYQPYIVYISQYWSGMQEIITRMLRVLISFLNSLYKRLYISI